MHDIKAIRQDPAAFDKAMARRGLPPQSPAILKLDEERRSLQAMIEAAQAARNARAKEIGMRKAKGEDVTELLESMSLNQDIGEATIERGAKLAIELHELLASLPNIQAADIPDGDGEEQNVEIRKVGEPKKTNEKIPEHADIGEALGMMDFERAAKMSGSRFVIMHSGLARLERALAQFMLDTHTSEHGFTEVSPPLMVKDSALYGTGQLPKFAEDLYSTEAFGETISVPDGDFFGFIGSNQVIRDELNVKGHVIGMGQEKGQLVFKMPIAKHWLIPTAEVSLTNIVADEILDEESLPRRYTAHTPCFRSEAGAAGKDTKGMIRQHQFYKVEMVCIVKPEDSEAEHQRMVGCAENILKKLEIPFRTIVLCTGDAGFGSYKTYDIEVWLPGQQRYREISSCSNCGDFQARRMNARFKAKGEKNTTFVHTLNGSGLAVGRALIAVLENYYDPTDGGVFVPEVLKPYMGGLTKITKG